MWYNIIYYVSMFFGLLHRLRGTWGWFAKVNGIVLGLFYFFMYSNYYVAIFGCILYVLGESYGWGDPVGCLTDDIRVNRPRNFLDTEDGGNYGIRFFTILLMYPKKYKDIFYNAKITTKKNIKLAFITLNTIIYSFASKVLSLSYKFKKKLIVKTISFIANILFSISNVGFKLIDSFVISEYKELIIEDFINYSRIFLVIRGLYWWVPVIGLLSFININTYAIIIAIAILSLGWPLTAELGRFTARLWSKPYMAGGWEHQEVWYGALVTITFILLFTGALNV